jgi:lysophospholipase L1-like esterase
MLRTKVKSRDVLFAAIICIVFFGILELLTRFIFSLTYKLEFSIGTWRQYHPTRRFSLIPGYQSGRLSINSLGFLGPEFEIQTAPGKVRILTIGDSVTFDPAPNNYSRVLEKQLNRVFPNNPVEVIVAAVPGYSSYEGLYWYDEFLHKLNADIIIVYLGWNDMGVWNPFGLQYKNQGLYREPTFIGFLMRYLYLARVPYFFLGLVERYMPVDMTHLSEEQEKILADFYPTHYENNLTSLIRKSKAHGSLVYFLSLPGLITYRPTEEESKRMHFPRNIRKHLRAYKAVYEKYLAALKTVSTETQTPIIYLDNLIETPQQRTIFYDTMHITEEGSQRFGRYIANEIKERVAELITTKTLDMSSRSSAR